MALDDRAIFQSSQPFLYSIVRAAGNGIFVGFHTFHIDAHIAIDAEPVFRASASDVGCVGAGNHRLGRDAACVHAGAAKLVAFNDGNCLPAAEKRAARDGPAWPVPMMIASKRFIAVSGRLRCGACPLSLLLPVSSRPGALRCRRRTSPTSGASEPSVRTRHDAALSRAKALSASRRPDC